MRLQREVQSDEEFARRLHQEEEILPKQKIDPSKNREEKFSCQQCNAPTHLDQLYILDECTHRFCKSCLQAYVTMMIQKSVAVQCPLKGCNKSLSVRDMSDFLPKKTSSSSDPHLNPTVGSGVATERIMAELKHIMKSDPEKNGYSVVPIKDNLYKWELKLFNFDKSDPIGSDMAQYKIKNILLHIAFPKSYPFAPAYIRVIKPRFQYRTGHVTIGGSICMEALTNSGWSPANTMEAMIVSIRAQLIAGGARLDPNNKTEYTEQEAKEAFDRMVRDHNWY